MTNPAIAFVLAHLSELELDGQFGICDTEWTTVYIAEGKTAKRTGMCSGYMLQRQCHWWASGRRLGSARVKNMAFHIA